MDVVGGMGWKSGGGVELVRRSTLGWVGRSESAGGTTDEDDKNVINCWQELCGAEVCGAHHQQLLGVGGETFETFAFKDYTVGGKIGFFRFSREDENRLHSLF